MILGSDIINHNLIMILATNAKVLTVEWAINEDDAPESNNTLTGVELIENVPMTTSLRASSLLVIIIYTLVEK